MTPLLARRSFLGAAASGIAALAIPGVAWAEDEFLFVDPELRAAARMMQRAASAKVAYVPPVNIPLPAGVVERLVPARGKTPPVNVFVIGAERDSAASPRPAILHIHGGGFIAGSARTDLRSLKGLSDRLGCVIVSVEYRLAPAVPFPGSLEDNYSALRWLHDEAPRLGVDPRRIALLGESAGGGHVAMLAIAARDRGEVPIRFQALVYPMLDDRTGSSRPVPRNHGTLVWTPADNRKGWAGLLGQPAGLAHVPAGSVPARVASLAGLPPTFIGVGGIDLFVDEDIDYARRLTDAGVPTELLVVPGAFHGFQLFAPQARASVRFKAALENALARALAPMETW